MCQGGFPGSLDPPLLFGSNVSSSSSFVDSPAVSSLFFGLLDFRFRPRLERLRFPLDFEWCLLDFFLPLAVRSLFRLRESKGCCLENQSVVSQTNTRQSWSNETQENSGSSLRHPNTRLTRGERPALAISEFKMLSHFAWTATIQLSVTSRFHVVPGLETHEKPSLDTFQLPEQSRTSPISGFFGSRAGFSAWASLLTSLTWRNSRPRVLSENRPRPGVSDQSPPILICRDRFFRQTDQTDSDLSDHWTSSFGSSSITASGSHNSFRTLCSCSLPSTDCSSAFCLK